ncbi:MAG: carboxypeptidase-like regulatory domain-containing protein, partial [Candidatus Sulfotelmatobacter sp.]
MLIRISSLQFLGIKGGLRAEFVFQFVFLLHVVVFHPHLLSGQTPGQPATPTAGGRTIHGVVKSGNMPIPGAAVSAANTATKEQINTWTDVDGSYLLLIPADGHYAVLVQMAAFAASTQEVVLDAIHRDVQTNFELVLLSRAREAHNEPRRANAGGRGFQNLSVLQSGAGQDAATGSMSDIVPSGMPVPGIAPDSATESVAVSGNTSNSFNAMSADEMQQRFNDARQQGGGFGG